jgi:hypothetical protein
MNLIFDKQIKEFSASWPVESDRLDDVTIFAPTGMDEDVLVEKLQQTTEQLIERGFVS